MEWLFAERWSPYVVGASIGILSWIAFVLSDRPIGCSTAFARTSGMIGQLFSRDRIARHAYFRKFAPIIDWEWTLVVGVFLGAFISAQLSGSARMVWVPEQWAAAFGAGSFWRWCAAFAGGLCIGIGSRWAGGCTSGHGISGTLQLAVSSWLAVIGFFASGIITAMLLYGPPGR